MRSTLLMLALTWCTLLVAQASAGSGPFDAAVAAGRWDLATQQLRTSLALPDAEQRESQIYRQLLRLSEVPVDDPGLQASVRELQNFRSLHLRLVDPEGRDPQWVVAYPIADAAERALRRWSMYEQARTLRAAWSERHPVLDPDQQVLRIALKGINAETARWLADQADLRGQALAQLAKRLGDPQLFVRWLQTARAPEALRSLSQLDQWLTPEQAKGVLVELQRSSSLRAEATAALARRHRVDASWLLTQLGDAETGLRSAQLLAQQSDPLWVQQLAMPTTELGWTHSLLALHWSRTSEAREQLQRWLQLPQLPAHMREELQSW